MNVFHRVTLQSLRKNKIRTIVTIVGIILSTALICAVTTSVSSFTNFLVDYFVATDGGWEGSVEGTNLDTINKIKNSDKIKDCAYVKELTYAKADNLNAREYIRLSSLNGDFNKDNIIPIDIVKGEYPDSPDEILLLDYQMYNSGYDVGDTIELEIGDIIVDGEKISQKTSYTAMEKATEEFIPKETRTYTISGVYKSLFFKQHYAIGYNAIVLDEDFSEDAVYSVYFTMKNPKEIYNFISDNELNANTNHDLLAMKGVSRYTSYYNLLRNFAIILISLIMFGSISLIYNAFSISVSERTKQFGLLSSIGATRKQLRKTVFFEAFAVGVVGIPCGIIVGLVGIGITLAVIGNKISSIIRIDIPMKMSISLTAILIAIVVEILTVIVSAMIPSIRATRITAVEAIRQSKDIKTKNKPLKTPKFVYKFFGLSGMLGHKYFKRSKKKYRSTIMSLFMSIVLFISASAFSEYILKEVTTTFEISDNRYDISCNVFSYDMDEKVVNENIKKLYDAFREDENITDIAYVTSGSTTGEISMSYLTDDYIKRYESVKKRVLKDIYMNIAFVDDDAFRELLRENNLDENKFMNPENPLAIAFDGFKSFNFDTEKYEYMYNYNSDEFDFKINLLKDIDGYYYEGDILEDNGEVLAYYKSETDSEDIKKIPKKQAQESINLKCGKVLTEMPYWCDYWEMYLNFVYPYSMYENITHRDLQTYYFTYYIKSDDHMKTVADMNEKISDLSISAEILDKVAENERDLNLVTVVKVFAYGFIILISLISATNVFNTISTNIHLRRRDFAMLKSIGMTEKELRRMLNYECIIYGAKSLIYGLPVSAVVTYFIYRAMNMGIETDFFMPWKAVAIAVFSVFAVVFSTMLYSMSKIKSDNLIETLKNENT